MSHEKLTLKHPIPTSEDGKEITSLNLVAPRLGHIQKFILAIGADMLRSALNGFKKIQADATDEQKAEFLGDLVAQLITKERFDSFNMALADYLNVDVKTAEMIAPDDLIAGVKKIENFYPDALKLLKSLSTNSEATE